MSNKKKFFPAIPVILVFTILYIILAARPLSKEYQFEPEWTVNIQIPVSEPDEEELFAFKLGKNMGYFDRHGHITNRVSNFEKSSISDCHYGVYGQSSTSSVFMNTDGSEAGIIKEAGFPYFYEDQVYLFLPGGASFSKCDETGNIIWTYEGVAPITAFSAKTNYTAIGLADGVVKIFDNTNGNMILEYSPGGSDFPVILGLDISDDGSYIASVSGQNTQRFVLVKKENTQVKVIAHEFLPDGMNTQALVKFSKDQKSVIYNFYKGIGIADVESGKTKHQKINSHLISCSENGELTWLLGKEGNTYTVIYLKENKNLGGSFSFDADYAFIRSIEDSLFVGKNNTISKIKIISKQVQ